MTQSLKLAVVGDIHSLFGAQDVTHLNRAGYAAVLFVGDLTRFRHADSLAIARKIADLQIPSFVIPGNHDAVTVWQFSAELLRLPGNAPLGVWRLHRRLTGIRSALGHAQLCGYSRHRVEQNGRAVGVIACRPHAMGGRLSFAPYLKRHFGIASLEQSSKRLCQLVDNAPEGDLVFLAHNGPAGLGAAPTDPWGADFNRNGGDFGDVDLRQAIEHAISTGRRVVAVVAGHMHSPTRQRADRVWHVQRNGVHYVNAARVPRIFRRNGVRLRHHISIEIGDESCDLAEILVPTKKSA